MSKKKSRRMPDPNDNAGHGRAALARAQTALFVGNVREADLWSRVAERLNNAPASEMSMEEDVAIKASLRAKLKRLLAGQDEEWEEVQARWGVWEAAVWNEIRAEAGLPLLAPR
ncbi:MAG: hypothetical protein AB7J28_07895 [Hyphomonadaceae bacterium]